MNKVSFMLTTTWLLFLACDRAYSMTILLPPMTTNVSTCGCNITNIELDYYWLDYRGGPMPKNALVVNEFTPNGPTYVGRVFTKSFELLPATIRTTLPYATFTIHGRVRHANNYITVLCSHFPNNFRWLPCSEKDNTCNSVQNKIPSDTDVGRELFFGKHYINFEPIIGEIYNGMTMPYNGAVKWVMIDPEVYVLTYQKPEVVGCQETHATRKQETVIID